MLEMPWMYRGVESDDPSGTWPEKIVGCGKENMSLKTRECRVNVDRRTLNRVFSTWIASVRIA